MAVNRVDISTNERLQLNEESINSGTIDRKFGRPEDYIELHIYNQDDQLLTSDYNFTQYKFPEDNTENLVSELNMDPVKVLRTKGYTTGKYKLVFNIQRSKIFNTSTLPFSIKEISSTRRELKSVTPKIINTQLDTEASRFIREIEAAPYLIDFVLNFNNDINITGINLALNKNTNKHEVLIKLIDPLPSNIKVTDSFKIVEEITDPIILNVDLGLETSEDEGIPLQGPNFKIDVRLNNSVPSSFKNYDEILDYNLTSSYHNLLNYLENREIPDVSYDFIRTVSGSNEGDPLEEAYHFENFTHFSSAVERLKNFEYKIQLIELYDSQTSDINSITGSTSASTYVLENKEEINKKKQNLIKGFDGYERFLYYTSGTFAWPKQNSTPPYNLFSISSSESKTWLGSEIDTSPNYGGQLLSASLFDRQNENALTRLVPNHILDNPDNSFYSSFVNMVGQHFDQIWVHIKHLTEVNDAHHTRGISKELVYFSLKSLGLETFDQFENSNLIEYILGEGESGSVYYDTPQSQSLITASMGSIPKSDITKNIWKRLYHNAPYLLKTKGTERGLRALMSCYGVPSTILNVKEYGGSTSDKTTYKTFTNDKGGLALKGNSGVNGYFIKTPWSSSATNALSSSAKTVEFRIKPHRGDNAQMHLFSLSGSYESQDKDMHLLLVPYSGPDISSSGDADQYGQLILANFSPNGSNHISKKFPVYNGDFWNIFIGVELNQEPPNNTARISFGAYQSNHLKTVNYVTNSLSDSSVGTSAAFVDYVASSWGLHKTESSNHSQFLAGAAFCYIGGMEPGAVSLSDNLVYSGSLQEVRYHFGELLSHETLKKHALEPFMYAGNSVSSSYENLVLRLPLGSNDKRDISSFHPNINVDYLTPIESNIKDTFATAEFRISSFTWATNIQLTIISAQGTTRNFSSISTPNGHKVITSDPSKFNGEDYMQVYGNSAGTGNGGIIAYQEAINEYFEGEIIATINTGSDTDGLTGEGYNILTLTQTIEGPNGLTLISIGGSSGTTHIVEYPERFSLDSLLTFEEVVEEHYTPTPDTVGISTTSEKTRIETGTIDDDWLSPTRKTETSTLDNQPPDYEDLGVFFSPTNELNEDIIYTLGAFRLDDYIGSPLPSVQTASKYEDLTTLRNIYFNKVERRYNYWDYIKLIQYIDHTLFKLVEQWVPMKANLKTGLLIEPHYLERTKFARELPVIDDDQTMTVGSYNTLNSEIEPNRFFSLTGSAVIYSNNKIQTYTPKVVVSVEGTSSVDIQYTPTAGDFSLTYSPDVSIYSSTRGFKNTTNGTWNIASIIETGFQGDVRPPGTPIDEYQVNKLNKATHPTNGMSDPMRITSITGWNIQLIDIFISHEFQNPVYLHSLIIQFDDRGIKEGNVQFFDTSDNKVFEQSISGDGSDSTGGDTVHTFTFLQNASGTTEGDLALIKSFKINVLDLDDNGVIGVGNNGNVLMIKRFQVKQVDVVSTTTFETSFTEQGTNANIDIDDYILDEIQEAAQAPIKPYTGTQPAGYIARKSSTLLGNATKGRISRNYYRSLTKGKETEY